MHTIWLREHNRVANELFNLYGTAKSDEFYYQEARRIVIAEFQHITYNEYLPVILGIVLEQYDTFKWCVRRPLYTLRFSLGPLSSTLTTSSGNNAPANPAIYNEFAAAAYRMGHSQLRSFIRYVYVTLQHLLFFQHAVLLMKRFPLHDIGFLKLMEGKVVRVTS